LTWAQPLASANRSLYLGYKIHLAGLLLNQKGDRVAMANSVEARYRSSTRA
jgi:asparagine synthase (glutamine-hydrolysing)